MSSGNIHVEDPEIIRECIKSTISSIERYKEEVITDIHLYDETIDLCEESRTFLLMRCNELQEARNISGNYSETFNSAIESEENNCTHMLVTLTKGIERIESGKRDAVGSLADIETLLETAKGLQKRVEAFLSTLDDIR